jgi:hypothetical protein
VQAAWLLANEPAGLDAFQGALPSHIAAPWGASPTGIPVEAAKLLVSRKGQVAQHWKADPMWEAIEALAVDGSSYSGTAHMKAAQDLEEAGQRERAFTALTTAAYWMWNATQQPFPQLMKGAAILAEESGWTEVRHALATIAEHTRKALEAYGQQ